MIKKLKSWINRENKPGTPLWKALFFERRLPWRYKKYFEEKLNIIDRYHRIKNYLILRNLIRDKRVLILGSGPSANDLKRIPDDVLIFACNYSPKILLENNMKNKIDLFVTSEYCMHANKKIEKLFKNIKTQFFLTNNMKYIKTNIKKGYSKLLYRKDHNNYYLNKLIGLKDINKIKGTSNPWNSTGIILLQYALYFKAKEIFLIGMDLNEGHFYNQKRLDNGEKYIYEHKDIDHNFMKIISKKYDHIFSASKNSPITRYILYKKLE